MNAIILALIAVPHGPLFIALAENAYSRGTAIAFTGMAIVAFALTLIILFITALPHVLGYVAKFMPESEHPHDSSYKESQVADDEHVLAAIGYVLHLRDQHS